MKTGMDENQIKEIIQAGKGPGSRPETRQKILEQADLFLHQNAQNPNVIRIKHPMFHWKHVAALFIFAALVGAVIFHVINRPRNTLVSGSLVLIEGRRRALMPGQPIPEQKTLAAVLKTKCLLKEGTEMIVDSRSEFVVADPGRGERMRVRLKKGRVFLRVSKVPGIFMIEGNNGQIQVKGTIFGVEEKGSATAVSVFKGCVAVESGGKDIELNSGQSARADKTDPPVLTDVDPNLALLWARDSKEFNAASLGEILDWIEDNSSYEFSVPTALKKEKVSITISEDPMAQVIDVLFAVCGAPYTINGNLVNVQNPSSGN